MSLRRRYLGLFVLQIMLAAQLMLAQHATVHFMEGAHGIAHHEHGQGHDEHDKTDKCQICFLAKGFQNVLSGQPQVVAAQPVPVFIIAAVESGLAQETAANAYLARAPPHAFS